jgi:hypothetical protein
MVEQRKGWGVDGWTLALCEALCEGENGFVCCVTVWGCRWVIYAWGIFVMFAVSEVSSS